jgi:hypothetical protein
MQSQDLSTNSQITLILHFEMKWHCFAHLGGRLARTQVMALEEPSAPSWSKWALLIHVLSVVFSNHPCDNQSEKSNELEVISKSTEIDQQK